MNAHDHGRPVRSSSIGAGGKPLEAWLHYLSLFPAVDPYLAAVVALAQSAIGGVGTVMLHYTRVQGFTDLPTEAAAVARAARAVGTRVGFAVSMRDRNPLIYGHSQTILDMLPPPARKEIEQKFLRVPLSPAEHIALADAVAVAAGGPMFDVQYGRTVCNGAATLYLRPSPTRRIVRADVYTCISSNRYQRAWMDKEYPGGIVEHLDAIGLLSPRLTLAHCVWASSGRA